MKLGNEGGTPRTAARLDDAANRAGGGASNDGGKEHLRGALDESTDRRLVVIGGASGAGIVASGAGLGVLFFLSGADAVAATSAAIIILGGIGIGLLCGGCFSMKLVPRMKKEGLLGDAEFSDDAWAGDPLQAWDTPPGVDESKRYNL